MQTLPTAQARLVALLRLLLLAIAIAAVGAFLSSLGPQPIGRAALAMQALLIGVAVASGVLLLLVSHVRYVWQLALHLVFDLLWVGGLIFCTGGPSSPVVVLLFAIILIGNLVLPGVAPFVIPSLASLALAVISGLYIAGITPLPAAILRSAPEMTAPDKVFTALAFQVIALFLVDLLGQTLARRQSEVRRFAGDVLDQLAEGVLAVDLQGTLVYLNAEVIRLLDLHRHAGRPAFDLVGHPVAEALSGGDLAPVRRLLAARTTSFLRITLSDRHLVLRVSELTGRGGRAIGRTLLVADETRLRLLEESARRAERLASLGEMAAGIAHEVRNPLTSLRGCAQELAEICAGKDDRDAADLAAILVSEADRMGRIVEDFLSFARQRSPDRATVDVQALIEEVRALVRGRRDLPAGLDLRTAIEPDCPAVYADPDQLRQVLINLIGNALDALGGVAAPRLEIRAGRSTAEGPIGAEAVAIAVADNGCGIPEDMQERVFTPFFSTKAQGTGLGLSLVTRIVREHEGVLHLVSAPGAGTTLTVHLPTPSHTREYRRALGGGHESSLGVPVLR